MFRECILFIFFFFFFFFFLSYSIIKNREFQFYFYASMDTPRNMYQWHYTLRYNTLQYTLHTQPADVNQLDSVQLWSTCFGIIVVSPRFGAICTIAVGRLGDETAEMKLWRRLVIASTAEMNSTISAPPFPAVTASLQLRRWSPGFCTWAR